MTHADNERNYKVTKHRGDAVFVIKSNYKVKKHLIMTHAENVSKHTKWWNTEAMRVNAVFVILMTHADNVKKY